MADQTPNHLLDYNIQYGDDWDYNDEMQTIEERLIIRDVEDNLDQYEPHEHALFVASDSGAQYDGTGTGWEEAERQLHAFFMGNPWYDVRAFGAVGDGETDDTEAIQAAVDTAEGTGGIVFFPEGDYRTTSPILVDDDGIELRGVDGAVTIEGDGFGNYDPIFEVEGSAGTEYAIDAASAGESVVTTSTAGDAANLSAGQLVKITSTDTFQGSSIERGELAIVDGVDDSSGDVQLRQALADDYETSPTVQPIDAITDFAAVDLALVHPGGDDYTGLRMTYAIRPEIENVDLSGCGHTSIEARDCYRPTIRDCDIRDGYYDATGTSYGVAFGTATYGGLVENCDIQEVRHAFSTTSSGDPGVVRGATVRDNYGSNVAEETTSVYDTHESAENITFVGNEAHGTGFQIRAQRVTIRANEVHGGQRAVAVRGVRYGCTIEDNDFYHQSEHSIWTASGAALVDSSISNNDIIEPASSGLSINTALQNTEVIGNLVVACGGVAINFRDVGTVPDEVTCETLIIKANRVRDGGTESWSYGLYFAKAYDKCIVKENIVESSGTNYTLDPLTNSATADNL